MQYNVKENQLRNRIQKFEAHLYHTSKCTLRIHNSAITHAPTEVSIPYISHLYGKSFELQYLVPDTRYKKFPERINDIAICFLRQKTFYSFCNNENVTHSHLYQKCRYIIMWSFREWNTSFSKFLSLKFNNLIYFAKSTHKKNTHCWLLTLLIPSLACSPQRKKCHEGVRKVV